MARHNFLVQRCDRERYGALQVWADVITSNHPHNNGPDREPSIGRQRGSQDQHGNDGFATVEAARKECDYLRMSYPGMLYRIIQIIS